MPIDDIPANEFVTMTAALVRAFRANGCDPGCHCCREKIVAGKPFQLAEVDGTDEMLCEKCTPDTLVAKREREKKAIERRGRQWSAYYNKHGRDHPDRPSYGYSRPHRSKP